MNFLYPPIPHIIYKLAVKNRNFVVSCINFKRFVVSVVCADAYTHIRQRFLISSGGGMCGVVQMKYF